jgi:radical SAM protein with 4Fe4S-binding SPASM domain
MNVNIVSRVRAWFAPHKPLEKGIYHYRTPQGVEERYRLHLRVEANGDGILVINAAKVLHLNRTATEIAKLLIEEKSPEEAARIISRRYHVDRKTAQADFERLRDNILTLARTDEICPITYLDVERIEPFQTPVSAPYRMDLALTYRCNDDCAHCYVGRDKDYPELSTEEWKRVIDRCWDLGIPHICFTGGEPTIRDDLRALVEYAEDVGLVTGLLTNGRRLSDRAYLDGLLAAGLDHVQITIESHDETIHDKMVGCQGAWRETVEGVRNCVDADVYLMTNTTLTTLNAPGIEQTIDFLAGLGVNAIACNGLIYSGQGREVGTGIPEGELEPILRRVQEATRRNAVRFIWYTPTRYCELHPVEMELGVKACTAALYNMCVEPNGDVIPCQSYYKALGNILKDDWATIWDNPVTKCLRDRTWAPAECLDCPDFPLCGGGCPLYAAEHEYLCVESQSTAP